ncbi:MAG: prepilin-type N-terminal cleavage/methylation domain-containing protein [Planctomycetota bacterium]
MCEPARESGFTLLEVLFSMVILTLLLIGTLAISTETARFSAYADDDYLVQSEVQSSVAKLAAILRKTGRVPLGGSLYPLVHANGTGLDFLLQTDFDGNGQCYDEETGDIEWSPVVYTARRNPETGTLGIYAGDYLLRIIGTRISEVEFRSFIEDSALGYREIEVRIRADRTTPNGTPVSFTVTESLQMRN